MSKDRSRSNREKKKPKQEKPKVIQANPPFASSILKQTPQLPKKK